RAKLRSLRDVDDGARLARFGIEHGHLTREAASKQGACQVMLRVARAHDYEFAVKLDAVEAIIANALLPLWRMQPRDQHLTLARQLRFALSDPTSGSDLLRAGLECIQVQ